MKAVRIHSFGGPHVLRVEQIDKPQPKAGEVLVRIRSASVNPVDYKIREGKFPPVSKDDLPYTLGRDVCGVIEDGASPPREVMALLEWTQGGYAEYVALPRALCILKPRSISLDEAGAVPLAGMTAWQGLFQYGQLKEGQRVLIHAGAGGVGHFAVQFAAASGAEVISTASAANIAFVRDLGAHRVIDYGSEKFEDAVGEVDVVLDLVGGETRDRSWKVLRPGGILVSTLGPPDELQAKAHRVRCAGFMTAPNAGQLQEIAALLESGKVRAIVTKAYPLDEVAAAQAYVESQHPRGKVVLSL